MSLKSLLIMGIITLGFATMAQAAPGAPNFMPGVYGDGAVWGSKFTAEIPGPNGKNDQSFDGLYVVRNNPDGQLPVAEAAPGNPAFNGGRWDVSRVYWTADGFLAYDDDVPTLMSYEEILWEESQGHVIIMHGTFDGGPPQYFQCPLLPVK